MRRVAASMLFDPSRVDDVLQDAFIRLLKNGRHFETEQEAFNYIRRAVINTCLDSYRRQRRYTRRVQAAEELETLPGAVSEFPSPLETVLRHEQESQEQALARRVMRALRRLPAHQRQAIELVFNRSSHKRLKDICRENKIPYSTLRSRLLRALDQLRSDVQEEPQSLATREPSHEV